MIFLQEDKVSAGARSKGDVRVHSIRQNGREENKGRRMDMKNQDSRACPFSLGPNLDVAVQVRSIYGHLEVRRSSLATHSSPLPGLMFCS
jgi:hypothetical protein